jgi:UDP-glucose 4-epimerase
VRPFTMYGDYMNFGTYSLVIAKFVKALEKDVPLLLEGGGTQERDFVHAHDAIRALELIMEHGRHGDIFNIGTGKTVTVKEIADLVSHKQVIGPERTGAIQRTCADITRLQQLGYTPKIELLDWLTKYIADFKINVYH